MTTETPALTARRDNPWRPNVVEVLLADTTALADPNRRCVARMNERHGVSSLALTVVAREHGVTKRDVRHFLSV